MRHTKIGVEEGGEIKKKKEERIDDASVWVRMIIWEETRKSWLQATFREIFRLLYQY